MPIDQTDDGWLAELRREQEANSPSVARLLRILDDHVARLAEREAVVEAARSFQEHADYATSDACPKAVGLPHPGNLLADALAAIDARDPGRAR